MNDANESSPDAVLLNEGDFTGWGSSGLGKVDVSKRCAAIASRSTGKRGAILWDGTVIIPCKYDCLAFTDDDSPIAMGIDDSSSTISADVYSLETGNIIASASYPEGIPNRTGVSSSVSSIEKGLYINISMTEYYSGGSSAPKRFLFKRTDDANPVYNQVNMEVSTSYGVGELCDTILISGSSGTYLVSDDGTGEIELPKHNGDYYYMGRALYQFTKVSEPF